MKKLLKKFGLFIAVFIAFGVAAFGISRKVMQDGKFYNLKPDTKYLIVGHSHTECALDDGRIKHSQNFSSGGEPYFYIYQKLKKLLADNPQVKTVFISYANNQIEPAMDRWIWDDKVLYNYMPKYAYHMGMGDISLVLRNNPKVVAEAQMKSLKNFAAFMASGRKSQVDGNNWGGYLFLKRQKIDSLLKTDYLTVYRKQSTGFSMTSVRYLQKIIKECQDRDVRVVLVRMPMHPLTPMLANEQEYQRVRKKYFPEIDYYDFIDFDVPISERGDFDHLNHKGAKRFSIFFNRLLENGLLDSANPQQQINAAMQNQTSESAS